MAEGGHAHWFLPLCILPDCWCIRLQTGVALVGVFTAAVAAAAFIYHLMPFIMGGGSAGESDVSYRMSARFNRSMYQIYKNFNKTCKKVCRNREKLATAGPPPARTEAVWGAGSNKTTTLSRRVLPRFMRVLVRKFDDLPDEQYMPYIKKERRIDVNAYRPQASKLVKKLRRLTMFTDDDIERFIMNEINFLDPNSVLAGKVLAMDWMLQKGSREAEKQAKRKQKQAELQQRRRLEQQARNRLLPPQRARPWRRLLQADEELRSKPFPQTAPWESVRPLSAGRYRRQITSDAPGVPPAKPSRIPAVVPPAKPSRIPVGVPPADPSGIPPGVPPADPSRIPPGMPSDAPTLSKKPEKPKKPKTPPLPAISINLDDYGNKDPKDSVRTEEEVVDQNDPCYANCLWPRIYLDIHMNNERIKNLGEAERRLHNGFIGLEILGLILAIIAITVSYLLVWGCVNHLPNMVLPWMVFGVFYGFFILFYVLITVGLIFYSRRYWTDYTATAMIAGAVFFTVLLLLCAFVVASFFYMMFTVGYYIYHFPRGTQMVMSGSAE